MIERVEKPSRLRIASLELVSATRAEFWGLPLFLALFAVTFTLLVFLVSIFGTFGSNILPVAAVFTFLSAIFWVIDPLLKERLPPFVSSVLLIAIYLISAQVLILASGEINSPFFLVYCFVMFTGAMSHGLTGALVVTGIIAVAYGTFMESIVDLPLYLTNIIILWIVALMVGFLAETKKRVERRVVLQNARLTALEEITEFMRDLSQPDDVVEAGLEAAQKLLDADAVRMVDKERVVFESLGPRRSSKARGGEAFPLALGDTEYRFEVQRRSALNADEQRIVIALIDKIRLVWAHLRDRVAIGSAREEKERVLDAIGSAVMSVDDEGQLRTANKKASELLGIGNKRLGAINIYAPPLSFPGADTLQGESREVQIGTFSGEALPVVLKAFPETGESGDRVGWIVILENLGVIRRLEAGLRKAEALAAVGEMSARVAHEIRNPLGGILGFLGLAAKRSSGEVLGFIDEAKGAVNRLEMTVRDLLTFSSPTRGAGGKFPVEVAWASICRASQADPDTHVSVVVEDLAPTVAATEARGEPHLFEQVLGNLIRNGREALDELDGSVTARVRDNGQELVIEVDDDGPGCPADLAGSIFDPFVSGKARGSGLGLAIARKIVQDVGGSVSYERVAAPGGEKTRFIVAWPKAGVS